VVGTALAQQPNNRHIRLLQQVRPHLDSYCMRLSFGGVTPEKIQIGMDRLAQVIKARL
jgi:DNA-binding transcriptional MocR family regulator